VWDTQVWKGHASVGRTLLSVAVAADFGPKGPNRCDAQPITFPK